MRLKLSLMSLALCVPAAVASAQGKLIARIHDSGFPQAHDTYNGMGTASDGRIFYVLSSERFDIGAQMYCYDPKTDKIEHVGDVTEACGEKDMKTVVQGKSHVAFQERDGKLYFATHVGWYSIIDGMEKIGIPPEGWKPYPGGHFLAYDLRTKKFEDLGKAPRGEGILTMTMDARRGRLYGLTWPAGRFLGGLGVTVCNLDYPLGPNSFRLPVCAVGEHAYFRLHGRNAKAWFSRAGREETYNYLYSEKEIGEIVDRATRIASMSKSLTLVANNHYQGKEAVNILQIKARLSGRKVPVPPQLRERYPALRAIASDAETSPRLPL